MDLSIREMVEADRAVWAAMRAALWPEASEEAHASEADLILCDGDYWAFVAEADGDAIGFAEVAIRKYANGCDSRPVPFLEGIWVRPEFRRKGVGARLIGHAVRFFAARGFAEMGSDAELGNLASHDAHKGWGFTETERVVYFRKILAG